MSADAEQFRKQAEECRQLAATPAKGCRQGIHLPRREGPVPLYRGGGRSTYLWSSVVNSAGNSKSLANERISYRWDRAEQPGPPSSDSAR
jgi:hypothetical protein